MAYTPAVCPCLNPNHKYNEITILYAGFEACFGSDPRTKGAGEKIHTESKVSLHRILVKGGAILCHFDL